MRLELKGLRKSFDRQTVLDGVSLSLDGAQTLALIGPSGGGKSTLLRILGGLEREDAGSAALNGVRIEGSEERLLRHRRSVGSVFQSYNLFPHLTALRNITLPLEAAHGCPPDQAESRAREVLRRFRLEDHAHKKPAQLSGGQNQRVAIARAVSIEPKILIMDEPTSALDPEMVSEVLDMISELRAAGMDLIVATHQLGFARRVADHVVMLAQGRIVEAGDAESVFAAPRSEQCRLFLERVLKYD